MYKTVTTTRGRRPIFENIGLLLIEQRKHITVERACSCEIVSSRDKPELFCDLNSISLIALLDVQGASHRIAEAFRRRRHPARQTSCDCLQALLKVLDERGEYLLSICHFSFFYLTS